MARKRSDGEARIKVVSARLTQATYDKLGEDAQRHGLSRAAYVEHLIESKPIKVVGGNADALPIVVVNELKRVGNNLNQIAHARNAGADVDPRQFQTVLAEIIAVMCSDEALKRRFDDAGIRVDDARRARTVQKMPPPVVAPPTPEPADSAERSKQAQRNLLRVEQQAERDVFRAEQQAARDVYRAEQIAERAAAQMQKEARLVAEKAGLLLQPQQPQALPPKPEPPRRRVSRPAPHLELKDRVTGEKYAPVARTQPEPERTPSSARATAEEILDLASMAVDSIEQQGRLMVSTVAQKNEADEAARKRGLAIRLAQQLASKRMKDAERQAIDALAATPLEKPAPQPKNRWRFWS